MVRLTISSISSNLKTSNFLFFRGKHAPGLPSPPPPPNPYRVSKRPELGGIVSILLENPESRLNLSRETSIPILNNSSHKPTSRETYFGKIVIIYVIAKLGYPGKFWVAVMMNDSRNTKLNHMTMLACSIGGHFTFPAFLNQTFCC